MDCPKCGNFGTGQFCSSCGFKKEKDKVFDKFCYKCGGVACAEIDSRVYCEVGSPRKPPTIKCFSCNCSPINCTCPVRQD